MTYTDYRAKVIADSISLHGNRLTTVEVTFPRFLLPEVNTHRKFSRNSASSRARSLTKTIDEVAQNPFVPDYWGKHKRGMSADTEIADVESAREAWLESVESAVRHARELKDLGMHKQLVNRVLEPYMWHTAIISSTEWDNFFNLRISPEAQPEIQRTAQTIKEALNFSTPKEVKTNFWHLPYISDEELESVHQDQLMRISVARCARVSYLTQSTSSGHEEDLSLYYKLLKNRHLSPFEHVATPISSLYKKNNFDGWLQLRQRVESVYFHERR